MESKRVRNLVEAYASIYSTISESHFKVGDEVICKASGMEGEIIKVDPEEKGKYYTVKREDGKTMKYAPDELKLEEEEEDEDEKENEKEDMKEAKNGGVNKETETKFHKKLDTLVHNTFGKRPEEKKMKEEVDIFDIILEHLVAEGYAETNEAALAIMANMSEEWKQSIVEETLDERNRGEQGMSDREVIRRRNLGGNTRSTVSSGALGDHGSQGAIQKFHKGKQKIRQAIHKSGRYTRGDTGESGGKGRYEANKDHADGYPSITKRGQGPG